MKKNSIDIEFLIKILDHTITGDLSYAKELRYAIKMLRNRVVNYNEQNIKVQYEIIKYLVTYKKYFYNLSIESVTLKDCQYISSLLQNYYLTLSLN